MCKIISNNRLMPLCWALTLTCLSWFTSVNANSALELSIIPLQHRPAASLMPSLSPLVIAPATLTAAGNQLVLRANKVTSAQLRLLIDELDKPLRQYLIEVRQGANSGVQTQQLQANIKQGSIDMGSAERSTSSALVVRRTTGAKGGASLQSIRALEGYPAYIETGKEIPFWSLNEEGVAGQTYKAVSTGFYATLLSSDDKRFVMQLSTQQQDAIDNTKSLQTTHTQSTLSGRLGEWTAIGGTNSNKKLDTSTLRSKNTHSTQRQHTFYLRVTERY